MTPTSSDAKRIADDFDGWLDACIDGAVEGHRQATPGERYWEGRWGALKDVQKRLAPLMVVLATANRGGPADDSLTPSEIDDIVERVRKDVAGTEHEMKDGTLKPGTYCAASWRVRALAAESKLANAKKATADRGDAAADRDLRHTVEVLKRVVNELARKVADLEGRVAELEA